MGPAPYGWMIDIDHDPDDSAPAGTNLNARGLIGPRNISPAILKQLHAGQGRQFRLYDDDRVLRYGGRIVTSAGHEGGPMDYAPLNEFGRSTGATEIWYQAGGKWWQPL